MQFYRFCNLDPVGKTLAVKNLAAEDDAEACRIAAQIEADEEWSHIEIWEQFRHLNDPHEGDRLVRCRNRRAA